MGITGELPTAQDPTLRGAMVDKLGGAVDLADLTQRVKEARHKQRFRCGDFSWVPSGELT